MKRFGLFLLLSTLLHGAILFFPKVLNHKPSPSLEEASIFPREILVPVEMLGADKKIIRSKVEETTGSAAPATTTAAAAQATANASEATPEGELKAEYPIAARKLGEEGTVGLLLRIDENGVVQSVVIEKSSGHQKLDEAAVKSAKAAHFHPATHEGKAAASEKHLRLKFQLK